MSRVRPVGSGSSCRSELPFSPALFFLELGFEDADHIVHCVLFKVGAVDKLLTRGVEHILRCDATHILEGVDDPCVDFILEFIQVDIFVNLFGGVTVNIDGVACEH